jgi:putative Mn2+ efflux pump MntP
MIKEAMEEEEKCSMSISIKEMFVLAIATSIDALAAGVSFAMVENFKILYAVIFIGCITFILSAIGVKVGSIFGTKYNRKAQITGGVVLILLGIKIVLERYGILFG